MLKKFINFQNNVNYFKSGIKNYKKNNHNIINKLKIN